MNETQADVGWEVSCACGYDEATRFAIHHEDDEHEPTVHFAYPTLHSDTRSCLAVVVTRRNGGVMVLKLTP